MSGKASLRELDELSRAKELLQKAQEELAKSEERYRNLVGTIKEQIWEVDANGVYTYISPTTREVYGLEPEEVVGKTPFDLMPLEEADRVADLFEKIVESQEAFSDLENIAQHKDGRMIVMETSGVPFFDPDGTLLGYRGTARNITERNQAEEALQASRASFQNIVEGSADGIIIVDYEGVVCFVNSAAESLFGHKAEELIGESFGFPIVAGNMAEIDIIRKDGQIGVGEIRVAETRWNGKEAFAAMIRDLTQRKRAEEKILAALHEKEELLSEIHHRVKNNLQIVSSLLDMQALRIEDKKVVGALLDSRNRVQTMALIHTQLYQSENLAQVEMGNTISKLIDDLLQIYVKEENGISAVVTAEGVILPISQAVPLGLIINELVSNALKYAFPDTKKGSIEISMREIAGDFIVLTVKDDGVGIPKDFDISKTQTLGLKLVRTLAERQLKGELTLNRDGGTKFYIKYNKSNLI